MDDRKHGSQVDARKYDRDKEYRKHLRIDALLDVFLCHSDLLHDAESCLVFESFRDLLIVDYKHAGYEEYDAEKNTQVEQSAECPDKIAALFDPAVADDSEIILFLRIKIISDMFCEDCSEFCLFIFIKVGIESEVPLPHKHCIAS